jgi:CheY-like chemotaxis protein
MISAARKELSVMIIDDNYIDAFIAERVLKRTGVIKSIKIYADAREAIEYFLRISERDAPDLVLLDINMPEMNGFGFLEAFAEVDDILKRHCRIVMLSSSVAVLDVVAGETSPFVSMYLEKPFTEEKAAQVFKMMHTQGRILH